MHRDQDTDFDPRTTQLSGYRLNDRYLLGDLVSSGGMGAVYEGIQLDLGRRVAIKVLHPKHDDRARLRFEQEAAVVAALNHPHIVTVMDYGTDAEGFPFLVMEYIEGRSLSAVLHAERPLAVDRALRITRHILAALTAAHDAGLVHRDLKPGNIMISAVPAMGEFAKVIDFGIALRVHSVPRLTSDGTAIGTPSFMAPEQLMNHDLDHRLDIWAVGVLLYVMVTGTMPFGRAKDDGFAQRVMMGEPRPMNGACPPSVQSAILCALSKDPSARFPSALAFFRALGEGGQDAPPRPAGPRVVSETPTKEGLGDPTALAEPLTESPATVSLRPAHDLAERDVTAEPVAPISAAKPFTPMPATGAKRSYLVPIIGASALLAATIAFVAYKSFAESPDVSPTLPSVAGETVPAPGLPAPGLSEPQPIPLGVSPPDVAPATERTPSPEADHPEPETPSEAPRVRRNPPRMSAPPAPESVPSAPVQAAPVQAAPSSEAEDRRRRRCPYACTEQELRCRLEGGERCSLDALDCRMACSRPH